jgi:hypothetical protein
MGLLVPMLMLAAPAPQSQPTTAATTAVRSAISRPQDLEGLAAMERELNLSGEALARFREKADAERAALAAWTSGESGRAFSALARERAAAAAAKDLHKAKALWEQMRPLTAERSQLRRDKRAGVLATLTPEQLRQWAGYVTFVRVERGFARIKLTDEQRAEIRAIADVHAATAVEPEKVRNDPMLVSLNRVAPRVIAEAHERVLTSEQIETLRNKRMPGTTTRPEKLAPVERE